MVLEANSQGKENGLLTCSLRIGHIFGVADPLVDACNTWPRIVIGGKQHCRHSFVSVVNAAHAHIACAMKLDRCAGHGLFVRDLEHNYIDFYRNVLCGSDGDGKKEKAKDDAFVVPYSVLSSLAQLMDYFQISGSHPLIVFNYFAIQCVSMDHTFSDQKLIDLIGADYHIETPEESIANTRAWYHQPGPSGPAEQLKQREQTKMQLIQIICAFLLVVLLILIILLFR